MEFTIKKATAADHSTLVDFTLAEAFEAENRELDRTIVEEGVGAALRNPDLARYWILRTDEDVPIADISVVREWSDWNAGFYWWIQSLYIQKAYRGQGLLQALFSHVETEALKAGAVELRLYFHQENQRARRAYAREGFLPSPYKIYVREL